MEVMETAPTLEAVYQNIYALHVNPNPDEKAKSSLWLDSLQKSVHSWTIADELLQQKRDMHSCYFAAQTMRSKIQTSFEELPLNVHVSLRDTLMLHILRIDSQTDKSIITQLCMAIADLALLMSSWENPILDLIEKLSASHNGINPLIRIITLIPEELNSEYLRLGANRRGEIHRQLESNARTVFELLVACLSNCNQNQDIMLNIIKCFTAWICIHVFSASDITNNIIVIQCFNVLNSLETMSTLHEVAADCICALLQSLESMMNDKHMLELQLFNNVCQLDNAYNLTVAHEDAVKLVNYCRIFTILGESFLDKMINSSDQTPHYAIKSLDLVLNCVGHYDYEIAEVTFNLWYRLSDELYQKNNDQLTSHFKPYIERLISSLYRHTQMESDQEGLIDTDDTLCDFRAKVADLIKDVVFIIGSSNCFKQMFLMLQKQNVSWENSEAALFIMGNVAKNISPDENEIVPKVAEAILHLPENTHVAVRYTSIILLGELCDWIDSHPETLQSILNFLLYSLQQKNGVAGAAATALTSICTKCCDRMECHLNGLIEIARSLDNFEISNDLSIGILKGISIIISNLPKEQLAQPLQEICSFQLMPLCTLIDINVNVEKNQRTDPSFWLDRLAAIIRHVNPNLQENEEHPCLLVVTKAWPVISNILNKYQTDVHIMERTARCIRYAMRCIGKQASTLLEPLVKQMVQLYAVHQHSCFLYLGSILVDEFANINEQCTQGLIDMMQAFIEPTFNILQTPDGLRNHPDTVDDFFRLCSRFIQRCPIPFLQSPIVAPIIQCALLSCTLDHRDANFSVMKFFYNLLNGGRSDQDAVRQHLVHRIIQMNGEELIRNLLYASVYRLHSYMLSDVADVIIEMKAIDTERLSQYLRKALEELPKKNSGGCVTATQAQLDQFHASVCRSESTKAVTHALKDFLRLYR